MGPPRERRRRDDDRLDHRGTAASARGGADRGQRNGCRRLPLRRQRGRAGLAGRRRAARAGPRRRRGGRAGDRLDPAVPARRDPRPRGGARPWAGGRARPSDDARDRQRNLGDAFRGSADCGDLDLRGRRGSPDRRGGGARSDRRGTARRGAHRPDPALPSRNGACDHALQRTALACGPQAGSCIRCGVPLHRQAGLEDAAFGAVARPHPARGRRTAGRRQRRPVPDGARGAARPGRANQAALVHGQPCGRLAASAPRGDATGDARARWQRRGHRALGRQCRVRGGALRLRRLPASRPGVYLRPAALRPRIDLRGAQGEAARTHQEPDDREPARSRHDGRWADRRGGRREGDVTDRGRAQRRRRGALRRYP